MAEDRARSFIERYVIARAVHFRPEHEQEDLWKCTQMGKSAYRMIAEVAKTAEPPEPFANQATQGGMIAGASQGGFTGISTAPRNVPSVVAPRNSTPAAQAAAQAHTALMRHRLIAAEEGPPKDPAVAKNMVDRWMEFARNIRTPGLS